MLYGLVRVLEDGKAVDLIFEDKTQAENFVEFIRVYIQDVHPGNGYGAYWPGGAVAGVDTKMGRGHLIHSLVFDMARAIFVARKVLSQSGNPDYIPSIGTMNGMIKFHFDPDEIPAPQKENFSPGDNA